MASTITAGNATNGLALSCDNTGILELKTGTGSGTTAITADASQNVTVAGTLTAAKGVGGTPTISAYLGSAQTPTSGVFTKVLFDTELWDTNSNFSSSRFTPTVAGYYQVNSTVNYANNTGACLLSIFRNGSEYKRGMQATISSAASSATSVSGLVYCNGSTDYIEVYIFLATATALSTGQAVSYFDAGLLRSA